MERTIESKKKAISVPNETALPTYKRFFARKREDVFADLLIGTLVVTSLFVIFFNIL
jgi:hypothetical protein